MRVVTSDLDDLRREVDRLDNAVVERSSSFSGTGGLGHIDLRHPGRRHQPGERGDGRDRLA